MIQIAVFGRGNIGNSVVENISTSKDFELCEIVGSTAAKELLENTEKLKHIDVAVLAVPSRTVPELAASLLKKRICTVDSFDIHSQIPQVRKELDQIAKENNVSAITASGWDPGSDSVIRALFLAMAPAGITYTNFGPGVSMGHTVAVKAITGVKDALSITIPTGTGIHRRMVYIELIDGHEFSVVSSAIKADDYFVHDETHVIEVPDVNELKDLGHGVRIERKGTCGKTPNQLLGFDMKINNPALTAQMLVCSARAVQKQSPGCYTLIEIPPIDLLSIDRDKAIELLV